MSEQQDDLCRDLCYECAHAQRTAQCLYCRAAAEIERRQARIDALMLEFCPGEMSREQREERPSGGEGT